MAVFSDKRENLVTLENAFKMLKENPDSAAARDMLKDASEKIFPYKFTINISTVTDMDLFVMSVYPDKSTLDKIVMEISNNNPKVIASLWKQTKDWTIEIDRRILSGMDNLSLSERELVAIYCHEIGHIIESNKIPSRIINILQYEIANASLSSKAILKDKFFSKLLSLPILNACMMENNDSIKEEIKADKFAKHMGYQKELVSAMQKFQNCNKFKKSNHEADMKTMAHFAKDSIDQFRKRETSLLESTLHRMKEECHSVYLESYLDEILTEYFTSYDKYDRNREKHMNYFYNKANDLFNKEMMTYEFFGRSNKKTFKRIDPAELDYILVKTNTIQNDADKMALISYARSKQDMVNYYKSLLQDPDHDRKYSVPYTMKELNDLDATLNRQIQNIINFKLPDRLHDNILVAWPEGYDG